jgi:hypothetical protein
MAGLEKTAQELGVALPLSLPAGGPRITNRKCVIRKSKIRSNPCRSVAKAIAFSLRLATCSLQLTNPKKADLPFLGAWSWELRAEKRVTY